MRKRTISEKKRKGKILTYQKYKQYKPTYEDISPFRGEGELHTIYNKRKSSFKITMKLLAVNETINTTITIAESTTRRPRKGYDPPQPQSKEIQDGGGACLNKWASDHSAYPLISAFNWYIRYVNLSYFLN